MPQTPVIRESVVAPEIKGKKKEIRKIGGSFLFKNTWLQKS